MRDLRNDNPAERRQTPAGAGPPARTFLSHAQPQRTMSAKGLTTTRRTRTDSGRRAADVTAGRRGDAVAGRRVRGVARSGRAARPREGAKRQEDAGWEPLQVAH